MARAFRLVALLLALGLAATAVARDGNPFAERDARLIDAALAAMPAQRPGVPDLYVLGFAGDGSENVFGYEVSYLEKLMSRRYGAAGRSIVLANRPDGARRDDRPLATLDNLRRALAGIGAAMDPGEDLLFLYVTSHGTRKHALTVSLPGRFDAEIKPDALRAALDDAGIGNRVVIVSACYSGGFVPALRGPDAIVLTAARRDRTSFGCGDASNATYFGRALLIEGMNRDGGLLEAFEYAKRQIARRETLDELTPSQPQIDAGEDALRALQAWEATLVPAPTVPYPYD